MAKKNQKYSYVEIVRPESIGTQYYSPSARGMIEVNEKNLPLLLKDGKTEFTKKKRIAAVTTKSV